MFRLPSKSRDDTIDAAAAAWIARRDAGLSDAESLKLKQWCAQNPKHQQALSRYEATWSALGRPNRAGVGAALAGELQGLQRRDRCYRRQLAAAGLAAVLFIGFAWWQRSALPDVHHVGSSMVVLAPERRILEDGSIVEFPSGTEIIVDFTQAFRRVALKKGEAHFQVAKNAARPFLVEVSGVEVRAVGTAFAVQKGQGAVEILVTEGRVEVLQTTSPAFRADSSSAVKGRSPLACVDAGNRVVVSVVSTSTERLPSPVQPVAKTEIAERLAWRSPGVEFSGTPLGDVVTFLNRYNAVELVIEDSELRATALSGRFRVEDTEAFVRMVETGFGVTSSRDAGRIILRKTR